jgi:hypothetical protein
VGKRYALIRGDGKARQNVSTSAHKVTPGARWPLSAGARGDAHRDSDASGRRYQFGRYDTNEMVYAKSLLPRIPEDSLTLFDKGFLAAEILCGLTMGARNRHIRSHFLIPAKSNTCWEVISDSADDATVRMRVSQQARKKCPALLEFWNARAIRTIDGRGRERVLLTSLGPGGASNRLISWPATSAAGRSEPVSGRSSNRCWVRS